MHYALLRNIHDKTKTRSSGIKNVCNVRYGYTRNLFVSILIREPSLRRCISANEDWTEDTGESSIDAECRRTGICDKVTGSKS